MTTGPRIYAVGELVAGLRRLLEDRVVSFFEANGFREVAPSEVPAEKWQGYDRERLERVRCVRRDL